MRVSVGRFVSRRLRSVVPLFRSEKEPEVDMVCGRCGHPNVYAHTPVGVSRNPTSRNACGECGSEKIVTYAWSRWSTIHQAWKLAEADHLDLARAKGCDWCVQCDGPTEIVSRPVAA